MKTKDTKKFYKNRSMELGFNNKKLSIIKNNIGNPKTVLDLGAYDGRIAKYIKSFHNCDIEIADINNVYLKNINSFKKYIFDFNNEKWPISKKYDLIIFTDVIEHIFDVDQFMLNINKITRKNSSIIFSTPNIASLGRRLLLLFGKNPIIEISKHKEINTFNNPVVGHVKYFTLHNMKALCKFYGYKVECIIPTSITGNISIPIIEKLFPQICWHLWIKAKKIDN